MRFHAITVNIKKRTFPFEDIRNDFIEVKDKMRQPLTYLAEEDGDVVYYHQCIKQPDASKFVKAIVKEIN